MVELDCAGFTLCAFRFTALAILQRKDQVLLSRDQCWVIRISIFLACFADSQEVHFR
jgi:hypothetical protein